MQVLPPSSTGGPSRLFIMRPVATTLLMVAILLAGIIGVTDGIDRLTEGAKVEVVEAQSATTPEEKATSREYAKKGARS
ncbi:hypothetical protein GUI26_34060 [Escherichia coli]|nr:hypothetical protein [Escherichia coli]